ncbi:MAG TPA: hypothetical protein PLX97_12020 [Gemmatales bacterium]|nr:hypothetical protein [Gemmatales bacterium]
MKAILTGSMAVVFLACTCLAADDDENKAKKAKLPPLTFVGNYDGEIVNVDTHSDRLTLKIRGVVPKWVPNNNAAAPPGGKLRTVQNRYNTGNGGTYVPEEQVKEVGINLAPDLKVRLMNVPPASAKSNPEDKPKEAGDKKDESKTGDDKDKAEDKKPADKAAKPAAKKPAPTRKTKEQLAKELSDKDPDYRLGGQPGKKTMLAKGQIVRVAMGRNNDQVNPQIYGMVVYVVSDSK